MANNTDSLKENKILFEALIKLRKPGPTGYPLITVGNTKDQFGDNITIFRSNITGVQLQEFYFNAHNEEHMEKIRCTLIQHIYKEYLKKNEKLMKWIRDIGENPDNIDLFNRMKVNIENFCNKILTPDSSASGTPPSSPERDADTDSDSGERRNTLNVPQSNTPLSEIKFYKSPKKSKADAVFLSTELDSPPASQFDLELLSGRFNDDVRSPPSKRARKLTFDDDDSGGGGAAGAGAGQGGKRKRRTQRRKTQRRKTKRKHIRSKSRTKHKTRKLNRKHRGKKATKRESRRRSRK